MAVRDGPTIPLYPVGGSGGLRPPAAGGLPFSLLPFHSIPFSQQFGLALTVQMASRSVSRTIASLTGSWITRDTAWA